MMLPSFFDELEKISARGHVLVTGLPGAGKTTEARRISSETGLPLLNLDGVPAPKGKQWAGTAEARAFINKNIDRPHVIEGTHILGFKDRDLRGNQVFYVDQPREVIVGRLVKRGLYDKRGTHLQGEGARRRLEQEHDRLSGAGEQFKQRFQPEILSPMEKKAAARVKTRLMPHQKRVVERMKGQPGLVVAHGLGSGKTLTSIAAAVKLRPNKTTVLVPAALRANYEKEVAKHVTGWPPMEIGSLQRAALKGIKPTDMLIVDEAHRARDPKSKTHQELRKALANKRMLLTASPVYNKPEDVAPLVNIAAGDRVLPTGKAFNDKYVAQPPTGWTAFMPWSRKKPELVRKEELGETLRTWVDYHQSQGGTSPHGRTRPSPFP